MRRATQDGAHNLQQAKISIHALHEESDPCKWKILTCKHISIHALHEESDPSKTSTTPKSLRFQSTLSMRRATRPYVQFVQFPVRISIHALHEESDPSARQRDPDQHRISIHALHEESDRDDGRDDRPPEISIHALHEESDAINSIRPDIAKFQSTLSMRRATGISNVSAHVIYISIHALHEESDLPRLNIIPSLHFISIHALHEESDFGITNFPTFMAVFQSTLSMRRATVTRHWGLPLYTDISIHALHEESDDIMLETLPYVQLFQSTLSMRRATTLYLISGVCTVYFNPRSP